MSVRLYEENEVHRCTNCGLVFRVTFAAVPIDPITCCGVEPEVIAVSDSNDGLDVSPKTPPAGALARIYQPGELYTCSICGIDVTILVAAQPTKPLDCCGEGMELRP